MIFSRQKKEKVEFEVLNKKYAGYVYSFLKEINRKQARLFLKDVKSGLLKKEGGVYLIEFKGDVVISNMHQIKEKINALMSVATKQDTCIFSIESGGGTVTAYGELAYELGRVRESGINLITTVDQVAASGGYMLAVQGDKIYAAPNAVLGSIGVIVSMPNYKELLDKVGVKFQDYMAGKNKRPITPYNDPTEEGKESLEKDLVKVHSMFKEMVSTRRTEIDIDKVSEGDTFFGKEALELKMIDGFKTTNEMIMEYVKEKRLVTKIKYTKKENKKFMSRFVASIFDQLEYRILKHLKNSRNISL